MEIRKFLGVCLIGVGVLALTGCGSNKVLQSEAIALSTEYLALEKGEMSYNLDMYKHINKENVAKNFEDRLNYLKNLDVSDFDVDEFYNNHYFDNNSDSEVGSSCVADDLQSNYYNPKLDPNIVQEVLQDDSRIVSKDGKNVISVSDLNLTGGKTEVINYKGVAMNIGYDDVIETYEMMKKNPKYNYKYVNHIYNKDKKCIDIKYTSIIDSEYSKILRLELKNSKIVSIQEK